MNENKAVEKYSGLPQRVGPQTLESFTASLNEEPKKEWLHKTPDGKAEYIPIGIIEMQLRKDFMGLVSFNIVSERRELNEYIVVARISVFHPIVGQWIQYDGIGAKVITQNRVEVRDQNGVVIMDRGKPKTRSAELAEFNDTKQKNALEMNAPNAYAEAIKNAAKKIGKKYGADINREFEDFYETIYTDQAEAELFIEQIEDKLKNCHSESDLELLFKTLNEDAKKDNKVIRQFKLRKSLIKSKEKEVAL